MKAGVFARQHQYSLLCRLINCELLLLDNGSHVSIPSVYIPALLTTCTACDEIIPGLPLQYLHTGINQILEGGMRLSVVYCVWTMHKSICMYIPSPLTCIYWILVCLFDSTWYAVFSNHVPTSLFLVSVESQPYRIMFKTRDLISHRFYILWKKWRLINSRIATKLPLALSQVIFQLLRHATLLLYLI